MNSLQVSSGPKGSVVYLRVGDGENDRIRFSIPEFHGEYKGRPFAIRQVLHFSSDEFGRETSFELTGDPAEIGLRFFGKISVLSDEEIAFRFCLENLHDTEITKGHHTLHLGMSLLEDFDDPDGERTAMFTDADWMPVSQLGQMAGRSPHAPFRVGTHIGHCTLLWKMMARLSKDMGRVIAFGCTRGYAFASDHPDFERGLLCGCRWASAPPGELQEVHGRLYVLSTSLEDLQRRYVRDLK